MNIYILTYVQHYVLTAAQLTCVLEKNGTDSRHIISCMRNTGNASYMLLHTKLMAVNRLQFVKSSFGGQLPQYFHQTNGTSFNAPNFNDLNKEERSRYVSKLKSSVLMRNN